MLRLSYISKQRLQKRREGAGHRRSLGQLSDTETDDRTDWQKGGLSSNIGSLEESLGWKPFFVALM